MIEDSPDDLLAYLNLNDFAEYVRIDNVMVKAIYDGMDTTLFEGNTVISTIQPKILCRKSDVEDVDTGARVVVRNVEYEVSDIQDDGVGFTTLLLHKVI